MQVRLLLGAADGLSCVPRQGVGGPNAQGQTVEEQLAWYKLIYSIVEESIDSGGPLKVMQLFGCPELG